MQLFDLLADPGEQKDVATQNPAEVKRLQAAYERVNASVPEIEEVKRVPIKRSP